MGVLLTDQTWESFLCAHQCQWNLQLCIIKRLLRNGELISWVKEWTWDWKYLWKSFKHLTICLPRGATNCLPSRSQALFKSVPPITEKGKTEIRVTWQHTTASNKYLNISSGPWWQSMFHRIIGWGRHFRECHQTLSSREEKTRFKERYNSRPQQPG